MTTNVTPVEILFKDGTRKILLNTTVKPMIGALPVDGNIELYNQCKGFLVLDWDGKVIKVLIEKVVHPSWFESIDKGGIPLYGFNAKGDVICGLCRVDRDLDNRIYAAGEHIIIVEAERTDDFGWEAAVELIKRKARDAAAETKKLADAEAKKVADAKAKADEAERKRVEKEKFDAAVAKKAAELTGTVPEKRPRGRPRKNPIVAGAVTTPAVTPKKRGRPAKVQPAAVAPAAAEVALASGAVATRVKRKYTRKNSVVADATPKKRGRPPKNPVAEPKKRGRPRKNPVVAVAPKKRVKLPPLIVNGVVVKRPRGRPPKNPTMTPVVPPVVS